MGPILSRVVPAALAQAPLATPNVGRRPAAAATARPTPSPPTTTLTTIAQSSTERHMGPILSRLVPAAMTPARLTLPNVGRRPTMPQRCAGERIEPPVSVPIAKPTRPAAGAAPDPADEPLDPSLTVQGLLVRPRAH